MLNVNINIEICTQHHQFHEVLDFLRSAAKLFPGEVSDSLLKQAQEIAARSAEQNQRLKALAVSPAETPNQEK